MSDRRMAHLIRIGNSQGIRIPKPLIEQAHLEGKELKLQLVEGGLLITPQTRTREGWEDTIKLGVATHDQEAMEQEWLDLPLAADDELEW